jgi:hypothetical protein
MGIDSWKLDQIGTLYQYLVKVHTTFSTQGRHAEMSRNQRDDFLPFVDEPARLSAAHLAA